MLAYFEGNALPSIRAREAAASGRRAPPGTTGLPRPDPSTCKSPRSLLRPRSSLRWSTEAARRRASPAASREVVRAQYTAPDKPAARAGSQGTRRIRLFPRSNVPVQAEWFVDPITNQGIALIDSGVNLIVDGLGDVAVGPVTVDSIDISADRLVIWTENILEPRPSRGESFQAGNVPSRSTWKATSSSARARP